jgi:hypothetical protein
MQNATGKEIQVLVLVVMFPGSPVYPIPESGKMPDTSPGYA